MKRYRIVNGVVGGTAFLVTEAGRECYRPYVYSRDNEDYGVADTFGNSFGTVAAVFIIFTLTEKNTSWDYRFIAILALGLCGYELLQGPMGGAQRHRRYAGGQYLLPYSLPTASSPSVHAERFEERCCLIPVVRRHHRLAWRQVQ